MLAAVLEQHEYRVVVGDLARMAGQLRPDAIGLTSNSVNFYQAVPLAEALKKVLPETPVILGGPHINTVPECLL